jgi:hypothetical protein
MPPFVRVLFRLALSPSNCLISSVLCRLWCIVWGLEARALETRDRRSFLRQYLQLCMRDLNGDYSIRTRIKNKYLSQKFRNRLATPLHRVAHHSLTF